MERVKITLTKIVYKYELPKYGPFDRPKPGNGPGPERILESFAQELRVRPGWQHIYNNTHYRLSHGQAKRVHQLLAEGYQAPYNCTLWEVDDVGLKECPHCEEGIFLAGIGS